MRIKDILKFGGLADGKIIAGSGGINNLVESVSVLEVTKANNGRWFEKNQLSVSAFYAIKDDIEAQKELIKICSDCESAGIVLCHIDFWVKKVDESVIDLCNELNLPLIVVPSETAYIDIIIPINDRLLNIYSERYKYSLDIQSKFIELIIANKDIHDICSYISAISKSGIVILDISYNAISTNNISEVNIKKIESFCKNNFSRIKEEHNSTGNTVTYIDGNKYIIQPIVSGSEYFGLIALEDNSESDEEFNNLYIIIKYACIAIALFSTKKQRFEKMQDIYFRDYLADLFTWNFKDEQIAIKRGKSVNWDVRNKKLLILININSAFEQKELSPYENQVGEYVKDYLMPVLTVYVVEDNENNLIGYRSDNITILLEDDGNERSMYLRAKTISNKFLSYCSQKFKISTSIGISNYFEKISDISNAYKEALFAMDMGRDYSGENNVYSYSEFGYIPYLENKEFLTINERMNNYFLKPLLKYDEIHNTDLTDTLENLLLYNLNIAEVSEKMFIHRNTLLVRKRRIIEILDHNPFEMPYKLNYLILFTLKNRTEKL